jgi:hypothetical protein
LLLLKNKKNKQKEIFLKQILLGSRPNCHVFFLKILVKVAENSGNENWKTYYQWFQVSYLYLETVMNVVMNVLPNVPVECMRLFSIFCWNNEKREKKEGRKDYDYVKWNLKFCEKNETSRRFCLTFVSSLARFWSKLSARGHSLIVRCFSF